jgi:hypothetical protein
MRELLAVVLLMPLRSFLGVSRGRGVAAGGADGTNPTTKGCDDDDELDQHPKSWH